MIGRSTLNGINAIRQVRDRFQHQGRQNLVDGYLGTLIECFSTENSFFTAVEVTAGGRMFNHVVTSSSIGNAYLEEMNRMKLQGEVTFLPLDRLQVNFYLLREPGIKALRAQLALLVARSSYAARDFDLSFFCKN